MLTQPHPRHMKQTKIKKQKSDSRKFAKNHQTLYKVQSLNEEPDFQTIEEELEFLQTAYDEGVITIEELINQLQ